MSEDRIKQLKEIIRKAQEACKNEPERDGDKGACLAYHGYWDASRELKELENSND